MITQIVKSKLLMYSHNYFQKLFIYFAIFQASKKKKQLCKSVACMVLAMLPLKFLL